MKIVILGAGRIGSSLARNLSNSNYEVCIVDENKNKLSELEDKLDIMTVEGSASHLNTLKKSGLNEDTIVCLLYTSPSPRDRQKSRMPSSA